MNENVLIGELDSVVELIRFTTTQSVISGQTEKTPVSLGVIHTKREVNTGSEDEEGKIRFLDVRTYTMRFVPEVYEDRANVIIRDDEGDFDIYSIELLGRRRWMILKCSKRE